MSEATATKSKKKNTLYYINSVIVFLLMFGIGQLEPFAQVTPLGMKVLGVFVGVLYGWCTVSLIWPSLVGMIAIGTTGYCTVEESFAMGFGDDIPLMIIIVYVLAAYMEHSGLCTYIANWFLSRKIGVGRPWVFTGLIFAAAFFMSAFVSTYATILILWAIFYKICDQIGEPRRSKYTAIVISGIVIICGLTMALFPFKAFSVISIGLTQKAVGAIEINFITWTLYNTIIAVIMAVAYVLVCKLVLRPDMTNIKNAGENFAHLRGQKMNKEQKVASFVLVIFILGLMIPSLLPKSIPVIALLSNMNIIGIGTICMVALALVKTKDDKPYVSIPKLISNGVNWELIILVASTMPLCNALEAEEVGVLQSVIAWMTQTFSSLSPTTFLIAFVALFLVTTQFTHNLVLLLVFTPVLTKMGMSFGVSPVLVALLVFFTAMTAYATPAASSNGALIFGNTEWISTKHAYLCGFLILIVAFVVLIGIGIPLGNVLL